MIIGIPRETTPGEKRVALVAEQARRLVQAGLDVLVEPGAGAEAGFPDAAYAAAGARLGAGAFGADIVLKVQPPNAEETGRLKPGAALVGFLRPAAEGVLLQALAAKGSSAFALERMPRIARAQPMDALSAMSSVAGYKAVLIAAARLPRFFPLLMTAAGTMPPARVFVIGAGVAGLQAIATARRLGAVVEAYDTRPVVKEQVESLGAIFVELPLDTSGHQAATGYAIAQSEDFYRRQSELMAGRVAAADVVIATAQVPGQRAPVLVTEAMVAAMRPGSVIVDLAAEQGGNCALTSPGAEVARGGVLVLGPLNIPSSMADHASRLYARAAVNYLLYLLEGGNLRLDLDDELVRGPLVVRRGELLR